MHMQTLMHSYATPTPHRDQVHGRLLEEIAWLEARLLDIGHTGDCAYEKRMAHSYQVLLLTRRRELESAGHRRGIELSQFLQTSARYLFG